MARRLLVESGPIETRLALIEDGAPAEFLIWPAGHRPRPGEIRQGRIIATEAALGAYFIDIGLDRPAFLKRKDAPGATEGSLLAVEILRDADGDKAARVSARTPAALAAGLEGDRPAVLSPAPHPAARHAAGLSVTSALLGGTMPQPALAAALRALGIAVETAHGFADLFAAEGIADDFEASLQRVVPLVPSGRITIDETEALTAIDIDGGAFGARAANEAGARIAAREIRRRDLSGQIVIDFIGDHAAIAAGRAVLKQALAADPRRPDLAGGNLNGIVLITRARQGDSLLRAATEPCPSAFGRRFSPAHLAARLWREALTLARHAPGRAQRALVPGDVLRYLEAKGALAELSLAVGAPLTVEASATGRAITVTTAP
ncbi:ribonuclease E/G [Zavarzinia compransoris]|uniref:ribonuclease E/G n=1 Tax=Zavarzinia marina TaxID=2911065 RepID=UPI001F48D4C5|nr:ribonuclease E/G [Zavarzinia marina]MCF4165572.1 ribonuclease E/G [Zavarzinia marina]